MSVMVGDVIMRLSGRSTIPHSNYFEQEILCTCSYDTYVVIVYVW